MWRVPMKTVKVSTGPYAASLYTSTCVTLTRTCLRGKEKCMLHRQTPQHLRTQQINFPPWLQQSKSIGSRASLALCLWPLAKTLLCLWDQTRSAYLERGHVSLHANTKSWSPEPVASAQMLLPCQRCVLYLRTCLRCFLLLFFCHFPISATGKNVLWRQVWWMNLTQNTRLTGPWSCLLKLGAVFLMAKKSFIENPFSCPSSGSHDWPSNDVSYIVRSLDYWIQIQRNALIACVGCRLSRSPLSMCWVEGNRNSFSVAWRQ